MSAADGTLRLFVGTVVSASARAELSGALAPLERVLGDDVSWTRPAGWHVTLAFVGRVPAALGPVVDDVTARVLRGWRAPQPVAATTGEVAVLGRGAVTLAVHDEPAGTLAALGVRLQADLADAEVPVSRRPVRAHVTVARARRGRALSGASDVVVAPVRWDVAAVQVLTAHLGDGPARYVARSEHALG